MKAEDIGLAHALGLQLDVPASQKLAKSMNDQDPKIDPEFLDIMIQGISVLSNVATLASTWMMMRNRPAGVPIPPPNNARRDEVRQQLRQLRRFLEDTFDNMEAVLRLLEEARANDKRPAVLDQLVRFGTGTMLTPDELSRANNFLLQLENSATQARNYARNVVFMAQHSGLAEQYQFSFAEEGFVQQLNSILFESANFGQAMEKLRIAQQQAEDFLRDLERALRAN